MIIIININIGLMEETSIRSQMISKLKRNGLKLTGTRKALLDLIIKDPDQRFDAEELFISASKNIPGTGIATVYRNLSAFEKAGILKKTHNEKRFEYYLDTAGITGKDLAKTGKNAGQAKGFDDELKKIQGMQSMLEERIGSLVENKREKEIELENIIEDVTRFDEVIKKHGSRRESLIQIMLDFQNEYNWLPKHVLFYVSKKMDVPLTDIYSIASFYKFFNLEPRGKHSILVCVGTACHVRGSMDLLQRIVNVLEVSPGDTTKDLKFSLDTVNCLGCCALGPVMKLDETYYSNPTTKELRKLFKDIK